MQFENLTGQRFGRLLITGFSHYQKEGNSKFGRATWHCVCDCGSLATIRGKSMKNGSTLSCGCIRREVTAAKNHKHGFAKRGETEPEYNTWCEIIRRTENTKCRAYQDYGGRGISMCKKWRESYAAFLSDMGRRPSKNHSIDRKDNNGDYEPSNCRWATRHVQTRNKRNNIILTHQGVTLCAADWAARLQMKPATFHSRLKRGWTMEQIIQTPAIVGQKLHFK